MIQKIVDSGFVAHVMGGGEYRISDNWYGCSVYAPDVGFIKGEKTVYLSLQGLVCGMNMTRCTEDELKLAKEGALKYIMFMDNKNVLYRNFVGIFPDDEFVNEFIG